jgi:hypothetical protein
MRDALVWDGGWGWLMLGGSWVFCCGVLCFAGLHVMSWQQGLRDSSSSATTTATGPAAAAVAAAAKKAAMTGAAGLLH